MKLHELFHKVADELIDDGWAKGSWESTDGKRHCLVGAIDYIMGWTEESEFNDAPHGQAVWLANEYLAPIIREQYPEYAWNHQGTTGPVFFNDHVARNVDDVTRILEKAAVEFGDEEVEIPDYVM